MIKILLFLTLIIFFGFFKDYLIILDSNKILTKMETSPLMISSAGRRPLKTSNRVRMYNSIQVQPHAKKASQKKTLMQSIDREKNNSFFYRYNKQITINTNYHVNQSLIYPATRRQKFQKAEFTRIIGDIRDQDYSLPLLQDCDKRCNEAFISLPHQSVILTPKDTHNIRSQHHNMNFSKQLAREGSNLTQQVRKVNSLVSTKQSQAMLHGPQPVKKRSKRKTNLQLHDALKKIRLFDHDIGHRYGDQLYIPKQVPQYYDIQNSNEQIIRNSMSSPKGYVQFSTYKQKIGTRFDRSDPHWGMTINYEDSHQNPEWKMAKMVKIEKLTDRRMNQVYNKYPIRQSMQLVTPVNFCPQK